MNALLQLLLRYPERFQPSEIPCCLLGILDTSETPESSVLTSAEVKEPPKPHAGKAWNRKPQARMEPIAATLLSKPVWTYPGLHRPKLQQI